MDLQRCASTSTINLPARSASSSSYETISSSGGSVSRGRRRARREASRGNGCNVVAKKNGRTHVSLKVENFVMCVPRVQMVSSLPGAKPGSIFFEPEPVPALEDCPPSGAGWYAQAKYWLNRLRPAVVAVGSAIVFLIGRVGIGLRADDVAWLFGSGYHHKE